VFGTEPFRNGLFYVQDLSGVIAGYALHRNTKTV
jgi:hypothetical protein